MVVYKCDRCKKEIEGIVDNTAEDYISISFKEENRYNFRQVYNDIILCDCCGDKFKRFLRGAEVV